MAEMTLEFRRDQLVLELKKTAQTKLELEARAKALEGKMREIAFRVASNGGQPSVELDRLTVELIQSRAAVEGAGPHADAVRAELGEVEKAIADPARAKAVRELAKLEEKIAGGVAGAEQAMAALARVIAGIYAICTEADRLAEANRLPGENRWRRVRSGLSPKVAATIGFGPAKLNLDAFRTPTAKAFAADVLAGEPEADPVGVTA